jgi:serine/threonine-protein kinase
MQDPLIGLTLGGCRLEELIGRGGMGSVYKARRISLDRPVAVKLLASTLESDPEYVERFMREARAAASLDHPHVVPVIDVGEENGQHYLVMPFVEGENLEAILARQGFLPMAEAVRIARQVAEGLSALHARGIVHRDIKPANILVGKDGLVRITDFGLARNVRLQKGLTAAGVFMGTPEYVAPEQVKGPVVDARTDLYSLGICFYRMLSGELPFQALSAMEMATQQLRGAPIPLEQRMQGVDPRASALIARLLQKDPARRFQTAEEVAAALAPMAGEEAAPAPEAVPQVEIKGRRNPPPAPAPVPKAPAPSAPEISAGPKRRVVANPEAIVPREIAPVPPPPPRRSAPEPEPEPEPAPPPPPPPPPRAERPAAPPKPLPKPPRRKREGSVFLFWPLLVASCALFFSAGVRGVSFRADGFWEGLAKPLLGWPGAGLAGGGAALWLLAFRLNRAALGASTLAGPSLMLPFLAALCFYGAGFNASPEGNEGPLEWRALRGTWTALQDPVMAGPLGVWLLLAGLGWGMSAGSRGAYAFAVLVVLNGMLYLWIFALGVGPETLLRQIPRQGVESLPGLSAVALALFGVGLTFGGALKMRKYIGQLLVLLSAAAMLFHGRVGFKGARANPFDGVWGPLADHGIAFFLGAFLLFWGGWFLRRRE